MPRTVIIASAEKSGDRVTVIGTVAGTPAKVDVWHSHLQTLANKSAKVAYCAQRLAETVPAPTMVDVAGQADV